MDNIIDFENIKINGLDKKTFESLSNELKSLVEFVENNKDNLDEVKQELNRHASKIQDFIIDNKLKEEQLQEILNKLPSEVKKHFKIADEQDMFLAVYARDTELEEHVVYYLDNEINNCKIILCPTEIHIISFKEVNLSDPELNKFLDLYEKARKNDFQKIPMKVIISENSKGYANFKK